MVKRFMYSKIVVSGMLCMLLLIMAVHAYAQSDKRLKLYVWDFGTRDRQKTVLTRNFTQEFEESFVQTNCYLVLERKHYDQLMAQRDNEKAIIAIEGISRENLDKLLEVFQADAVIFGEVYDDIESGEIRITVRIQAFNGENIALESVRLPRGKRFDAASREKSMEELAKKLCSSLNPPSQSFQNFEEGNGTPSGRGNYFWDAWRTTCSFSELPEPVYEGRRAVRVEVSVKEKEDQGGTVGINPSSSKSIDLSSAKTISVRVYDTNGDNDVQLRLRDINGNLSDGCWSEKRAVKDKWTNITWSLSDDCFTGIDKNQIKNIEIYEWWGGVYYFDDVRWQYE